MVWPAGCSSGRWSGRASSTASIASSRPTTSFAAAIDAADYKSGKGDKFKGIDGADPVQGGSTLQLGLYSEAVIQHHGASEARALYWLIDAEADAHRGYPWTGERRERFLQVISGIVEGIEAGVFAAIPGDWNTWSRTHDACRFCPFDSVCPRDRGERKTAANSTRRSSMRRNSRFDPS